MGAAPTRQKVHDIHHGILIGFSVRLAEGLARLFESRQDRIRLTAIVQYFLGEPRKLAHAIGREKRLFENGTTAMRSTPSHRPCAAGPPSSLEIIAASKAPQA